METNGWSPVLYTPDEARLKIYEKLLSSLNLPIEGHMERLQNLRLSEKLMAPCGGASRELYESIRRCRSFDCFGCTIRKNGNETNHAIAEHTRASREQFFQGTLEDLRSHVNREFENHCGDHEQEGRLVTPQWKIGMKSSVHGKLNSEGNDKYFSYDGTWQDGKMDGEGLYKYCEGSTYQGLFKNNAPNGNGTITYKGGTLYVGDVENGNPHGKGKAVYQDGIVYEGQWRNGERHGQGLLTLPSGAKYEGGFKRGRFHGRGTYTSKNTAIVVKGSFERGFIFGAGTVYFPDGRTFGKFWPEDSDQGFTIHDAIAHAEQVWDQEHESKQKELRDLASPLKSYQTMKEVVKVRMQLAEAQTMQKARGRSKGFRTDHQKLVIKRENSVDRIEPGFPVVG